LHKPYLNLTFVPDINFKRRQLKYVKEPSVTFART